MAQWFKDFNQQSRQFERSLDRAILGGRLSENVSFSFAAAYQSAIESLFQTDDILLSSFCVSEEKGNHPRDIHTKLFYESGNLVISGTKQFVSGANDSQRLYISCRDERSSDGIDTLGRPILKMIVLPAFIAGLQIQEMPALGFIPEVSHGRVFLDHVEVSENQILKGDGYLAYIKAFRNHEDLHVLAAITAYRLGEAIEASWPKEIVENHISLILALRSLADMDLNQSSAHIALAACRSQLELLITQTNAIFEKLNPKAYQLWKRDKVLLNIAKAAHQKRTEGAWQLFDAQEKS